MSAARQMDVLMVRRGHLLSAHPKNLAVECRWDLLEVPEDSRIEMSLNATEHFDKKKTGKTYPNESKVGVLHPCKILKTECGGNRVCA